MNLKEAYRDFLSRLQTIYNLNEATVITDWVFESTIGIKKSDVIKNPAEQLSHPTIQQLNKLLDELLQNKPVQYVLGEAWFCNMKLKVNEQVLIPRPETEELVQWIVSTTNDRWPTTILDIGTGSGCIAIALKKRLPHLAVTAIDISEGALAIAKENAASQHVAIDFLQLDFLNEKEWDKLSTFDIIVSNPPYIPTNEKDNLEKNVTAYEPHSALFVPDNVPLLFYEKIAAFGKTHLAKNGKLFAETHENFAKQTAMLFSPSYQTVEIKKDLFGKERMVQAG